MAGVCSGPGPCDTSPNDHGDADTGGIFRSRELQRLREAADLDFMYLVGSEFDSHICVVLLQQVAVGVKGGNADIEQDERHGTI